MSNPYQERSEASSSGLIFVAMGLSLLLTACGGGGGGQQLADPVLPA